MIFVTSQMEFKFTMSLVNDDDPNNVFDSDPGAKRNGYLMKGIVLMLMGLTLEYSQNTDLYIFRLCVCISVVKILEGWVIFSREKDHKNTFDWFIKVILSNFTIAYGILNSVKYI